VLDWIYIAISWILLRWHDLWDKIMPSKAALGTNWQWILAIVSLVITIRVVLFPVFVKQIKSQRAMQALQPRVKELQAKHKGDRETMQKELMELYRTEKANPLMGCLPMFLQVPVFLGLFHTLRRLRPGRAEHWKTLYGWTTDQFNSAADAKLFHAPIAAHLSSKPGELAAMGASGTAVKIVGAALVLTMIATTFLTSRQMILKTGWSEDPQQKMIQRLMLYGIPASLLFSGYLFPLGVVIYWSVNNAFSLGQQFWVLHKYPPPKIAGKAVTAGKTTAGKSTTSKTGGAKPGKTDGVSRAAANGRASLYKNNDKTSAKTNGEDGKVDGRALAPRPGAKPVNPKKGGAARRQPGG
jgi:YidC/Oxa1 family membrane protein insertase